MCGLLWRVVVLLPGLTLFFLQQVAEDFDVVTRARLERQVKRGGLVADPVTGGTIWLNPAGVFVDGGLDAP